MATYDLSGRLREPCPMCGSLNVRWRGRRFYHVPLNMVRYLIEAFLHALGFGGKSASHYAPEFGEALQHHKLYDDRMSAQTPRRFWKCPECKQRGEVFDDLGELSRRTLADTYDRSMDTTTGRTATSHRRDGKPGMRSWTLP